MRLRALFICVGLTILWAAALPAQSVRGRVLDAESGAGIAGVRIVLLGTDGTAAAEVVTNSEGAFHVAVRYAGEHRLQASHLGYRTATTESFRMELQEQLIVDMTLSTTVIQLDPLRITGRRRDPRHEPTVEGFYARQLLLPPIGSSRAITVLDAEMVNARDARDVMTWLPPPRVFRGTATTEGQVCLVVYWNGHLVNSEEIAERWLETSAAMLEGLEYYRTLTDAPLPFHEVPPYLMECPLHSVLALWGRTGYYGEPPVDLSPSPHRVNVATGLYHVAGDGAPTLGTGVELAAHWPVRRGLAVGLHVRRTSHHVPSETTQAMVPEGANWPFLLPPGRRPLTLWVAGLEPRVTLPGVAGVWPVVAARFQLAHRALMFQSNSAAHFDVPVTSWGRSVGVTLGAERLVHHRFAVHAAVGYDRLFLDPYPDLERRWNPTAATWSATSLRLGIGYALDR